MIIESLSIREGMGTRTFRFDGGRTVVCSCGQNSVGKTTLMRCLLYSLGEDIPGTQRFKISKHAMRLILITDQGKRLKLLRDNNSMRIIDLGNGSVDYFSLPYDLRDVKYRVYGVGSRELADNILGAYYIDQDKGWTLLNRGKVISGIRFSIEGLLRGLSDTDCTQLIRMRQQLKKDIEKYSFIVEAANYQEKYIDDQGVTEESPELQAIRERLAELRVKDTSLRKRTQSVQRAQRNNERFVEFVSTMGLRVRLPNGEEVRVTADNLVGYDDTRGYLEGEALSLCAERAEILEEIRGLEAAIAEQDALFQTDKSSLAFDRQIAKIRLDVDDCRGALESLKKQLTSVDVQLKSAVSPGHPAYDTMSSYVVEYCRRLGIEQVYLADPKGLLTSDLKSQSGTNYQLLVFAFRMAYASTIRELKGIRLPLVIDSIRRGEMSGENIAKCFELLATSMKEHQQIIATIDSQGIASQATILIENSMMDKVEFVTDIAVWEDGE